jgi:hypothetical protein
MFKIDPLFIVQSRDRRYFRSLGISWSPILKWFPIFEQCVTTVRRLILKTSVLVDENNE